VAGQEAGQLSAMAELATSLQCPFARTASVVFWPLVSASGFVSSAQRVFFIELAAVVPPRRRSSLQAPGAQRPAQR